MPGFGSNCLKLLSPYQFENTQYHPYILRWQEFKNYSIESESDPLLGYNGNPGMLNASKYRLFIAIILLHQKIIH